MINEWCVPQNSNKYCYLRKLWAQQIPYKCVQTFWGASIVVSGYTEMKEDTVGKILKENLMQPGISYDWGNVHERIMTEAIYIYG